MTNYLSHGPHYTELLGTNKALQHNPHSHVDILFIDIVSQMHLGMSLSHTYHRLNVTNCDWNTVGGL